MSAWLPILSIIILTAVALSGTSSPPAGAGRRRLRMAAILACGVLAIVVTVREAQKAKDGTAALSGTTGPPNGQAASDLVRRVEALADRVSELEAHREMRTIPAETAEKFAAYLRPFGPRRVVVSCTPDDIEAYQYANQLVNILKAADWEAQGPETTTIFGEVRALGINVYVNKDDNSDTSKIILDGFKKFNIPYQSRVTPSQAIPAPDTVELFVGTKKLGRVNRAGE